MEWYYLENNTPVGPMQGDALISLLQEKRIRLDTLVNNPALPDWIPLQHTTLLGAAPLPPNPVSPLYSPPPPAPSQVQNRTATTVMSPHLCWVNLVFPGLSQFLMGQRVKGLMIFFVGYFFAIVGGLLAALLSLLTLGSSAGVYALLALLYVVMTVFDAYRVGVALSSGREVGKWQWFPK